MARSGMSAITVKPSPNVYTGLALVSFLISGTALGYVIWYWFKVLNV